MNKEGFTLVELMAVIVLLAIISTIATISFKNASDRVKKQQYENKVSLIEMKASEYASEIGVFKMTVDQLVKRGYLQADNEQGDVISPLDGEKINCYEIIATRENGNYYAKFSDDTSKVCE